jgi:hypothetical protein
MLKRKQLTLPSGATCVIRPLKASDMMGLGSIPDVLIQSAKGKKVETSLDGKDDKEIARVLEYGFLSIKASLLKACGVLVSNGQRYNIVDKPAIDAKPSEITIEEIDQADAEFIYNEVKELSGWTKGAAEAAQTFPEKQESSPAGS